MADILVDRIAGDGLETVHEIVPAQVKPAGQGLHRQLLLQMGSDIAQDLLHLGIAAVGGRVLGGMVLQNVPVDGDEQLQKGGVGQQLMAELLIPQCLLQLADQAHILQPPLRGLAQQVESPLPGHIKAGAQALARGAAVLQIVSVEPQNDPLIGLRGVDAGHMDHVVLHQQNVPGPEEVAHTLYHIGHPTAQQEDDLIKFMVVVLHLLRPGVLEMEETKIFMEVPPSSHLTAVQHRSVLLCRFFT